MKRLILIAIPALLTFASCQKDSVNNPTTQTAIPTDGETTTTPTTNTQGYVQVKCDNCKIDYGMPDQYKGYNITGQSGNLPYTYTTGYTLQANIYALDHTQDLTYTVFDSKGKQVFTAVQNQTVENYWAVSVLLP